MTAPAKRGRGRPKLGDEARAVVAIRLKPSELAALTAAAGTTPVSVWIREAALARARRVKR